MQPQVPNQRPQVYALVSALVQAMEAGKEVYIQNRMAVVPHCFRIRVHHEAYDDLRAHLPRLKNIAEQQLNEHLKKLQKQGVGDFWPKIWRLVQGVLLQQKPQPLEISTLGKWEIEVVREFDVDVRIGYLEVEAGFSSIGQPPIHSEGLFMGHRTKGFSFLVAGEQAVATAPRRDMAPVSVPTANGVLATLSWFNSVTQTEQVFQITTPSLAIGREGASDSEYAHLPVLRLAQAPVEISRVHGYFRFQAETGMFRYKNVGPHGTRIQPPAIEQEDGWMVLAPNCKLCMGDKLFVQFTQTR